MVSFRKVTTAAVFLSVLIASQISAASSIYHGELDVPKHLVERGFYLGPDFGMMFMVNNDTSIDTVGFVTGITMGYDINQYVSVIGMADFAIFQAGSDLQGGVNMFMLNGGVKGTYRVTERLWPFLRGLAGMFFTDPDIKESTAVDASGNRLFSDVSTKTADIMFGAGILYYMDKRHFSFEFSTDYIYIKDYPFDAVNMSASLRYTF